MAAAVCAVVGGISLGSGIQSYQNAKIVASLNNKIEEVNQSSAIREKSLTDELNDVKNQNTALDSVNKDITKKNQELTSFVDSLYNTPQ
jgi:hypothetical protein